MTTRSKSDIGFGKKVRVAWLDMALDFVANGVCFEKAKPPLSEVIANDNPGPEAIQKVLAGLNRLWFNPPDYCLATRDAAVSLYQRVDHPPQRLALHFGMAIAAYPFIGAVAEAIGRLLRLQGTASIRDVKRRVGEKFGEREFVERIVRYDVSSFVDWGILAVSQLKGDYIAVRPMSVSDPGHAAWLIEALLHSRSEGGLSVSQVRQHPLLFPFALEGMSSGLAISRSNPRLHTMRHGHTEELVVLLES
jgi:hypothetical protein